MADAASPNDTLGRGPSPSIGGRILRLIVPVPRGRGIGGKVRWVVKRIVLWYVILLVMLSVFQRYLIYQPTRSQAIDPGLSGLEPGRIEPVSVTTSDGVRLNGWFVPAYSTAKAAPAAGNGHEPAHPVAIYFSGNAGHRGYRGSEMDLLSRLGADVYLFDYRGYGDNAGSPTEQHLADDARAVWNYVTNERKTKPARVVLVGESLGGGVATRLASDLCAEGIVPGGLVLRSTFSSLTDVASYHYPWLPVRFFLIDRFPSADRIASVTCPILKLHGTDDDIVPLRYGKRLFEAAPAASAGGVAKTFVEMRGTGHNDVLYAARAQYQTALRDFLARLSPPQ